MSSKAERLSKAQRHKFLYFFDDPYREDYPCENGHMGCSNRERGACLDEVLSILKAEVEENCKYLDETL